MAVLRMGTRGSALALAQSGMTARALERAHPGLTVETVVIKTSGDLFGAPAPEQAKALPQGAKGLFVKEIEDALLAGSIDFAVHSAKDLPAELAPGLEIAAYPEREDPRDAFVGREGLDWAGVLAGARVATSSLRRQSQIASAKPGVLLESLRGNVDTRLRKLKEGLFDGMVIALAGLKRLGRADVRHEALPIETMLPAPAQGALALEVRSDRRELAAIAGALDHAETRLCVEFERGFLAAIGGGCAVPVGAYGLRRGGGVLLQGFWAEPGAAGRRVEGFCADPSRRDAFVRELAAKARAR